MSLPLPMCPADAEALLNLGVALGENKTYGRIAGGCSAVQAGQIRQMHEDKTYRATGLTWEEFCPAYLNLSRSEADKIIRLYEEFGSKYFRVSETVRVSAETYRTIEPAILEGAIHYEGEVIDLAPENAQKVAAAIAQLRRNTVERKRTPPDDRKKLESLERRCTSILAELDGFARKPREDPNSAKFRAVFGKMRAAIDLIAAENHV